MHSLRPFAACVFFLLLASVLSFAQSDRIVAAIDSSQMTALAGTTPRLARSENDQGAVNPSLHMPAITMMLKTTPAQQAALQKLLAQQMDPKSPHFRKWLTPQQFADRFGVSHNDLRTISNWLQGQGFTIVQTANGRNWISFSGTAAQVQNAFHTEIHHYSVNGEDHFSNATDLSVPKALSSVVSGFRGLNDFRWKPMGVRALPMGEFFPSLVMHPDYTFGSDHFLAPDDIATIYNLTPLLTSNPKIDGTGISMVIVGQSDITLSDIRQFRSGFGLAAKDPQVVLVPGSPDPKHTGDEIEADLDLEWAGAVARNSNIIYVNAATSIGGVLASTQYAVDQNLAPIINFSFGLCEADLQPGGVAQVEPILQQAQSLGISFFASSGDSGAADCDNPGQTSATQGLAVNYPASSPEATGVGGTEFNEGSNSSTYWNSSNGTNGGSAKSYIPEVGWNDTPLGFGIAGTGGGVSDCAFSNSGGVCTSGFLKPSWQTGAGVPNDGVRDEPDVSLTASADHDGYILCTLGTCANGINGAIQQNSIVGGTSASSPVFAGIVALLNQYMLSQGAINTPGLGLINPTLYELAASPGVYHDVTTGNNIVPCLQGTPDCPTSAPFQYGYNAGANYDLVTGLGSVDGNVFVTTFACPGGPFDTSTSLNAPTQIGVGASGSYTVTVAPTSGSCTPSGTVTLFDGATQIGTGTLSNGSATVTATLNGLGNHSISATYAGSSTFNASTSSTETVTVVDYTFGPPTTSISIARGQNGLVTLTLTPNGITQQIMFTCAGTPAESTCTAPPVTPPNGTDPVNVTFTITTRAPSGGMMSRNASRIPAPFYALLLPGVLGVVTLTGRKSRRRLALLGLLLLVAVLSLMPACGGGGGGGSNNDPGTPTGNFNLTVTAAGAGLSKTATIALTVTQ